MRSHLVYGKVRHSRTQPTHYELAHDVFYFALDVDELDEATNRGWLVGRNRRAILSFRDADHLPKPATDLAHDIREHLKQAGVETQGGRIVLVTNLRMLGYVFNPASFFLCRDPGGALAAVVVEVHNTYGERHLYTLKPERPDGPFSAAMDKDFYVSPFISIDGRYRVTVRDEPEALNIGIALRQDAATVLATSLTLRRRPIDNANVLRLVVRHPFLTQRTTALIHWHALRLWLRRVRFHRHTSADARPIAPTKHESVV